MKNILHGLRLTLGITLILLGLVGLIVPIMQGWLLIVAGAFLIKPEYAKKIKEKLKNLSLRAKRSNPEDNK